MKYSEEFTKPDYTKGPYPPHNSVGGEKLPANGTAQPRKEGPILTAETDDMPIGLSFPPEGNKDGDFGPYIMRTGEGLPNSFSVSFENKQTYHSGNVHPHTGMILFALALNLRPKVIVETGTFSGYSTMYLAKACEVWGEGKVYTIDTNAKFVEQETKDNPYIECITNDSRAALPKLLEKLGEVQFAFIDSWKRIAYTEFSLVEPYIAEGGIVAFHDTQFLNTGRALYNKVMANHADKYDTMLFTGFPHKDNGHRFFGNADDRGLFIIRKKTTKDPFLDVKDWGSRNLGSKLV
jgi:predicted O-methyltransferase YrrM